MEDGFIASQRVDTTPFKECLRSAVKILTCKKDFDKPYKEMLRRIVQRMNTKHCPAPVHATPCDEQNLSKETLTLNGKSGYKVF